MAGGEDALLAAINQRLHGADEQPLNSVHTLGKKVKELQHCHHDLVQLDDGLQLN